MEANPFLFLEFEGSFSSNIYGNFAASSGGIPLDADRRFAIGISVLSTRSILPINVLPFTDYCGSINLSYIMELFHCFISSFILSVPSYPFPSHCRFFFFFFVVAYFGVFSDHVELDH